MFTNTFSTSKKRTTSLYKGQNDGPNVFFIRRFHCAQLKKPPDCMVASIDEHTLECQPCFNGAPTHTHVHTHYDFGIILYYSYFCDHNECAVCKILYTS